MKTRTGWIAGDATGTKLFLGPKPEYVNGIYDTCKGPIGKLPQQTYPYSDYRTPVQITITIHK
jgi:hypothetical protein